MSIWRTVSSPTRVSNCSGHDAGGHALMQANLNRSTRETGLKCHVLTVGGGNLLRRYRHEIGTLVHQRGAVPAFPYSMMLLSWAVHSPL
eukprot:2558343-Pleurochrysis_carterae.AAC.1